MLNLIALVGLDRFECCVAHAGHEVRPVPEQRLPVELIQMLFKTNPCVPCTGGLEVVDYPRLGA
jgi:hypothetical protein